ncbi:MAG: hypothetical protein MZU84_09285 [Sphingobacterium sp.]|nr:hypothetical protein [Sphingobacterium sp.]
MDIKAFTREIGFDLAGVADVTALRGDFQLEPETRERFPLAVSLGKGLSDAVLEDIRDHPTSVYFHHYRQMNFFLDRGALLVADRIQKSGLPVPGGRRLPDRRLGQAAGPSLAQARRPRRRPGLVRAEQPARQRGARFALPSGHGPHRHAARTGPPARPRLPLLPCLRRRVPGPGHQGHPGGLRPSGLLRDAQGFPQEGLHDAVHLRHLRARLPRPQVGPGPIRASGDSDLQSRQAAEVPVDQLAQLAHGRAGGGSPPTHGRGPSAPRSCQRGGATVDAARPQ